LDYLCIYTGLTLFPFAGPPVKNEWVKVSRPLFTV
jgi:hypothetical protein